MERVSILLFVLAVFESLFLIKKKKSGIVPFSFFTFDMK